MDTLTEFLERSTIHGFSYISKSESKIVRCFWLLTVISGFVTAGVLINGSFKNWRESPVGSTITTYPISKLPFPNVTICPPVGSNTVLNHDLERVGGGKLNGFEKEQVMSAAQEVLLIGPHVQFARRRTEMVSLNLRDVYEGYQSLPKSTRGADALAKTDVVEMKSSLVEGQFVTLYNHDLEQYCHHKNEEERTYVVEFPENIKDYLDPTGSVVINLDVNFKESNDFVTINRGATFFLPFVPISQHPSNFTDAEQQCFEKGGTLASILNADEKTQLYETIRQCKGCKGKSFWLGAKRNGGFWSWSDGNLWNQSLSIDDNIPGDCLMYKDERVQPEDCAQELGLFQICKLAQTTFRENANVSFVHHMEKFPKVPKLSIHHHRSKPDSFSSWFAIKWKLVSETKSYELKTSEAKGNITIPRPVYENPSYSFVLDLPDHLAWNGFLRISTPVGDDRFEAKTEFNVWQKKFTKNKKPKPSSALGDQYEMTWANAEKTCSDIGGNLPSVHSLAELRAVSEVLGIDDPTLGAWLGGRLTVSGHWVWSDGSPWTFDSWDETEPGVDYGNRGKLNNCTVIWSDMTWYDWSCPQAGYEAFIFACQTFGWLYDENVPLTNQTLRFSKESSTTASLHLWIDYKKRNKTNYEKTSPMPYPAISWNIDNHTITGVSHTSTNSWRPFKGSEKNHNIYLVRLVNLVSNAKQRNMTGDQLRKAALDYKLKEMVAGTFDYGWCDEQEVKDYFKFEVFEGFLNSLDYFGSPTINR